MRISDWSSDVCSSDLLQADPTIIYPITKGKPLGRRIRRSEIEAINDYNTYAMAGLPAGPIANPGRASIEAVLNPAKTDAPYFVADGRGGTVFSDILGEHKANVRKWVAIRPEAGQTKKPLNSGQFLLLWVSLLKTLPPEPPHT